MKPPLLYRVSRLLVSAAAQIYFSEIEVDGRAHLPPRAPLILAANHPQSITDALVLGLAAGRMVHYLAHSGLFRGRIRRWFLLSCGAIPVYRRRDVGGAAQRNEEAFDACYDVLEGGGTIGIFPEGTSGQERRVQKLRTGAARIALQCEARRDWSVGVMMVPTGIAFESRGRFRTRVLVRFAEPIRVSDFMEDYRRDSVEAVVLLTARLDTGIRSRVVDVSHAEYARLVTDVEQIYRDELMQRAASGTKTFSGRHDIAVEIPRAIEYFLDHKPDVVASLQAMLRTYRGALEELQIADDVMNARATIRGESLRLAFLGIAGFPFALAGAIVCGIPFALTRVVGRLVAQDLTRLHFSQIVLGAGFFVPWIGGLVYLAWYFSGMATMAIVATAIPFLGIFAYWYGGMMRRRRKLLHLAWMQVRKGVVVQRLRVRRRRLIAAMDEALKEYLVVRVGGVVGGREGPEE